MTNLQSFALRNELDDLRRRVAVLERDTTDGTFNPYVVTLTASTVNPSLGTGSSRSAIYSRVGDLVLVFGNITFGTADASAGTGDYRISLPFPATDNVDVGSDVVNGRWSMFDGGGPPGNRMEAPGVYVPASQSYMMCHYSLTHPSGTAAVVRAAGPWVWGNNYRIQFTALYRAAPY